VITEDSGKLCDFETPDFWYYSCHLPENVRVSRPKRF
jgi:hypothetical protein